MESPSPAGPSQPPGTSERSDRSASGTGASPPGPRGWLRRLRWADLLPLVPVAVALVTVLWAYLQPAVPPGGDSGHWLTTSYGFVGRAHPSDFTDQPLAYPPLTFVVLGAVVLATPSALSAAPVAVGVLILLYGLTTVHLARRCLRTTSGRVLFVGAAVLSGITLDMLFWGGFPNFLALAFMNEAFLFLLAFVLTQGFWDGLGFFGFALAVYLTHDLTFVILAGGAVLFVLLWFIDRGWASVRIFRSRGLWAGLALFVAGVGAYELASDVAGVPHPNYLYGNPASYEIENLGTMFRPFHDTPAVSPAGPIFIVSPPEALGILFGLFGLLAIALLVAVLLRPGRLPPAILLAGAWLGSALFVPAAGWVAHVDTDYPRFAYFLVLPAALLLIVAAEWGIPRLIDRRRASAPAAAARAQRWTGALGADEGGRLVLVGAVLVVVFVTATVPSVDYAASSFAISSHDPAFLEATDWLNDQPGSGAVLTEATAARWVEALTDRNSFSAGIQYLHYYDQQIEDDYLSFWALSSHYAATDNVGTFAFTGYNDSLGDAFPEYAGTVEGVEYPVLRIAESSLTVGFIARNGTWVNDSYSAAWGLPEFTLSPGSPLITATFTEPYFTLNESAFLLGNGSGTIDLVVLPAPGVRLTQVGFQLATPYSSSLAKTVQFAGIGYAGGGSSTFNWSVQAGIGPTPGPVRETVLGTLSRPPNPLGSFLTPALKPNRLALDWVAPATGFSVAIGLSCPGWSNPTPDLPPTLNSAAFLRANDIRYLLVENLTYEAGTATLFAEEFGFALAYENPEWQVYEA